METSTVISGFPIKDFSQTDEVLLKKTVKWRLLRRLVPSWVRPRKNDVF
jgi:hypothetical protein